MTKYTTADLTAKQESEELSELLDEAEALRSALRKSNVSTEEAVSRIDELDGRLKSFVDVSRRYERARGDLEEARGHAAAGDFEEAAFLVKNDLAKRLGRYRGLLQQGAS